MTTKEREGVVGWQGDKSVKLLKCSTESTGTMKQYYKELHEAKERGEPVIWTSTFEPQEIFRAMGLNLFFMVHYSALCAAKQMSRRYLDNLQKRGWSRDICRYCGQRLGCLLDEHPEDAPWGGPPQPDLIVRSSVDDLQSKIEELMAEQMKCPIYIMDRTWPIRTSKGAWHVLDVPDYRIEYIVKQYRELIGLLEFMFHKTLDMEKLKEAVRNSVEIYRLWWEVGQLRKTVPAPITSSDHWPNIIPLQFFRGTKKGVDMVRRYHDEVKERVDKGLAAVPNERIRLMWPGAPPWFTAGFFNAFEEKYGAVFVWEVYGYHFQEWFHKVDAETPMEALAKLYGIYSEEIMNAPSSVEVMVEHAQEYSVDGVILLLVESCKAYSNSILLSQRALSKAGIPSMILRQDIVDIRDWDDHRVKAQVSAFIETLDPERRLKRR